MASDSSFAFDVESERQNCLFAIPKKGRLFERVMQVVNGAGLDHHRPNRLDVAHCTNLPVTIVFLPASDIATYVAEGNVDVGITGTDCVREAGADVETIMNLGFGGCKLCVQAPVTAKITHPRDLAGKRIVTSFPNLAREYFQQFDTPEKQTSIKFVSGSVEAACGLGLADAVVDLVETGTTMRAAGLEVVSDVLTTEAILVSSKSSRHADIVNLIKQRIKGYMTATSYMMISYNATREILPTVIKITPGKRAPTMSELDGDAGVAVSALVLKSQASKIMDQLEAAGATDILLFSISNSRM